MQREITASENYDFITLNELPELSNDHLWLLKSPEEKLMGNLVSNRSLIINKSATSHASRSNYLFTGNGGDRETN